MAEEPSTAAWPATPEALIAVQLELGARAPDRWQPGSEPPFVGACFVCFARGGPVPGEPGERGWAGAALWREGSLVARAVAEGRAPWGYETGLLALREGPLLEAAARQLPSMPDVLLVDATGRDHPRRAGLALHLGVVLGLPTVGVTHRPLLASGDEPWDAAGAVSPLRLDGEVVGFWLRTVSGTRPLAVHAGWRTEPATAADVVMAAVRGSRTPEPLRIARQAAREARELARG